VEYDPHAVTMGDDIGSSVDALPVSDALVIETGTPSQPHTTGSTPP